MGVTQHFLPLLLHFLARGRRYIRFNAALRIAPSHSATPRNAATPRSRHATQRNAS